MAALLDDPRGIALLVGLLVSVFIVVLALSLFELVQRENHFHVEQEAQNRAYLTARAGFELFKAEAETFTDQIDKTHYYLLPDTYLVAKGEQVATNQFTQVFSITVYHGVPGHMNGLESVGMILPYRSSPPVLTNNSPIAVRTLFVPELPTPFTWDFSQIEDESE